MAEESAQAAGGETGLMRHGKVSYMQIPAIDVDVSAEFYAKVFGWNVRGDRNHRGFDDATGELIGAFVTNLAVTTDPGILPYVYVDRIDETLRSITDSGGQVVREPYPEGNLWVATFRDPAGNVVGVWQAGPR